MGWRPLLDRVSDRHHVLHGEIRVYQDGISAKDHRYIARIVGGWNTVHPRCAALTVAREVARRDERLDARDRLDDGRSVVRFNDCLVAVWRVASVVVHWAEEDSYPRLVINRGRIGRFIHPDVNNVGIRGQVAAGPEDLMAESRLGIIDRRVLSVLEGILVERDHGNRLRNQILGWCACEWGMRGSCQREHKDDDDGERSAGGVDSL